MEEPDLPVNPDCDCTSPSEASQSRPVILGLLKRGSGVSRNALDLGSRPSPPRNLYEKRGEAVAIVARPLV
jgi:hypothetical protein